MKAAQVLLSGCRQSASSLVLNQSRHSSLLAYTYARRLMKNVGVAASHPLCSNGSLVTSNPLVWRSDIVQRKRFSTVPPAATNAAAAAASEATTSTTAAATTPEAVEAAKNVADATKDVAEAAAADSYNFISGPIEFLWGQAVEAFQSSLIFVHDMTGIPWWATVMLTTLVVRGIGVPFSYKMQKNAIATVGLRDEIAALDSKLKDSSLTLAQKNQLQLEKLNIMKKAGTQGMIIGLFIQFFPLFLFFSAIRSLVVADPTFAVEGLFWFTDLSAPDTFPYMLPIVTGLTTVLSAKVSSSFRIIKQTSNLPDAFITLLGITLPFLTSQFCAGLHLNWITSNIFTAVQTIGIYNKLKKEGIEAPKENKPVSEIEFTRKPKQEIPAPITPNKKMLKKKK